jgi:hypothetical protein
MKFYEALKEVLENGKKVRRSEWDAHAYIYANEGMIFTNSGNFFAPANRSLASDDWEIVKTKVKKSRTVWINCYKESTGAVWSSRDEACNHTLCGDFLFTKEVTFEWEEEE